MTTTAATAPLEDATSFRSGRQFPTWLGLVPHQTGTVGRARQQGIEQGRRRLSEKIADARCSLDHQQGLVSGFHQGQQALGPHKQDG